MHVCVCVDVLHTHVRLCVKLYVFVCSVMMFCRFVICCVLFVVICYVVLMLIVYVLLMRFMSSVLLDSIFFICSAKHNPRKKSL